MSVVRAAIPVSGLLSVVLLAVLAARAETPVNFSGTWQLDKGRSTLPSQTPAAPGDLTLVIEQNGVPEDRGTSLPSGTGRSPGRCVARCSPPHARRCNTSR